MNTNDEIFISNFEDFGIYEVLNEIGIYKNEKYNFSITVDGDGLTSHNFVKDPYFKVYDSKSPGNSEPVRIAFKDGYAHYVIHNNNRSTLDRTIRKQLDLCMDKIDSETGLTIWELIKQTTCLFADNSKDDINRIMSYEKPNFNRDLKGVKLK